MHADGEPDGSRAPQRECGQQPEAAGNDRSECGLSAVSEVKRPKYNGEDDCGRPTSGSQLQGRLQRTAKGEFFEYRYGDEAKEIEESETDRRQTTEKDPAYRKAVKGRDQAHQKADHRESVNCTLPESLPKGRRAWQPVVGK